MVRVSKMDWMRHKWIFIEKIQVCEPRETKANGSPLEANDYGNQYPKVSPHNIDITGKHSCPCIWYRVLSTNGTFFAAMRCRYLSTLAHVARTRHILIAVQVCTNRYTSVGTTPRAQTLQRRAPRIFTSWQAFRHLFGWQESQQTQDDDMATLQCKFNIWFD